MGGLGPVRAVVLGDVDTVLIAAAWLGLFTALVQRDRLS